MCIWELPRETKYPKEVVQSVGLKHLNQERGGSPKPHRGEQIIFRRDGGALRRINGRL